MTNINLKNVQPGDRIVATYEVARLGRANGGDMIFIDGEIRQWRWHEPSNIDVPILTLVEVVRAKETATPLAAPDVTCREMVDSVKKKWSGIEKVLGKEAITLAEKLADRIDALERKGT